MYIRLNNPVYVLRSRNNFQGKSPHSMPEQTHSVIDCFGRRGRLKTQAKGCAAVVHLIKELWEVGNLSPEVAEWYHRSKS